VTVVTVLGVAKKSDTHILLHIFCNNVLVFSVVCMIGGIFNYFIKCLDPNFILSHEYLL
jgi:hypothetical protein